MSGNNLTPAMTALLHQIDPPMGILFFVMPLRTIRVVYTDDTYTTFRVEQLAVTAHNPHNPKGHWVTLSTHSNRASFGAYLPAAHAAVKAQQEVLAKANRRQLKKGAAL